MKDIINENLSGVKGKNFDCIVPVTGGGDSFFIVHVVKNILGLNPLLVNYNSHFNTKVGIRNLANLQTVFDCEVITSTLNPNLLKRITKATMKKFGSMYWQVLAGNTVFPVQMAVKFRTPLIIWGVHGWSEQTGMFSHLDEAEMTASLKENKYSNFKKNERNVNMIYSKSKYELCITDIWELKKNAGVELKYFFSSFAFEQQNLV